MENEKGSILISTLLFVSVSAVLIVGIAKVVSTQTTQLKQIQYSYEARSMISMTETILFEEFKQNLELKNGKVMFNNGEVKITKQSDKVFLLKASLDDGYAVSKECSINTE